MTTARARASVAALLAVALATAPGVRAHRLDEYLQATLVVIDPDNIRLQINLTPGVIVAEEVIAEVDRDRDGAISEGEVINYAASLKRDLGARLDGSSVELKLTSSAFPSTAEFRAGLGIIQLEFTAAPGRLAAGAHIFVMENRHRLTTSVYLINAARPKVDSIQITAQKRNETQSTGEIEFTFQP